MSQEYLSKEAISQFIASAFVEDIGDGDHSTLASIPENAESQAELLIKDNGIIAGLELAKLIFEQYDSKLLVETSASDGDPVEYGQKILKVSGSARSILSSERLVLNCLQRMSGIATYTSQLKQLIDGTKAQLLDTRKTTPNFRLPEKWAVSIGGGTNHRYGLYDMIMLKDNHLDFAGGIRNAIKATHDYLEKTGRQLRIEIETRNLDEVEQVMAVGGVDVIMLDNMSPEEMAIAVKRIGNKYQTEASGGITEKTIAEVAESGVDFISIGALTHSVKSLDMSLKAVK
ncbi:MAG: carboxylating nicotinate-nucleotide diphosphorylase [Bacteroidota bacterium]